MFEVRKLRIYMIDKPNLLYLITYYNALDRSSIRDRFSFKKKRSVRRCLLLVVYNSIEKYYILK